MDAKKVLTHLVRAGRDSLHIEKTLNEIGYQGTPYFNLHGEIADAIYEMIGEDTEDFNHSETYAAMNDIYTTDEICAERLAEIYHENEMFPDIPSTTMDVIAETAEERGISIRSMVGLILSEWAMRQTQLVNLMRR